VTEHIANGLLLLTLDGTRRIKYSVIRMPPTSRLLTRLWRHLSSTCNILKFAVNSTIYRIVYASFICHTNISCIKTFTHEITCRHLQYCTIVTTYIRFKTTLSKRLLAQSIWAKTAVVIPALTRVRVSSVPRNYRSISLRRALV